MPDDTDYERVIRLAEHLHGVEQSIWYGTPALKVNGKGFVRIKEGMDRVLVVMVPLGLKEALMEAEPDKYFETPHYTGWPAMLVRLDSVDDGELSDRLECAWLQKAPAKMQKERI